MMQLMASLSDWSGTMTGAGLSNFVGIIEAVAGGIEAVAAVVNLALVIFFFKKERDDHAKQENERIEEVAYDCWYDILVRKRFMDGIDEYFREIEAVLTTPIQEKVDCMALQFNISKMRDIFSKYKRLLMPMLAIFDEKLKSDVWDLLSENHDQILDVYESHITTKSSLNMVYEKINSTKTAIYNRLYKYNLQQLDRIHKKDR